jgi:branched-chain amino acid transport system substrate-binding protein
MKRLSRMLPAIVLGFLSMAGASSASAAEKVVKIGFAAPLTGPSAADGKEMENAARLAIEDANKRSPKLDGVAVRFELESQDDQSDPRIASQVAQRFSDIGVAGVVGHFNSSCSIAASRTYDAAKIAEVSPSSTGASYTQQGLATTFRVVGQDAIAGETLARYIVDSLHGNRIAIVDDQTDFGRGLADRVEQTLRAQHANVVAHEYVTNKTIDFNAIVTKLKSVNPDIIVFGGFDAQAGQFVRRVRSFGLKATLVGEGFNNNLFLDMAHGDGEGTVSIQPGIPSARMPSKDFGAHYKARFKAPLQGFQGPYAYDAATVIVEAVLKAQSAEPAKVLQAVKATRLAGATGPIAFDAKGDLVDSPYTIYRLKRNQWQDLAILKAQ